MQYVKEKAAAGEVGTLQGGNALLPKILLLGGALAFTSLSAMELLFRTWWVRDDYSHGFIVPLISAYFIWKDRHKLRELTIRPNVYGGMTLTLIGVFILLLGTTGGVAIAQQFSVVVILPGLVWLVFGTSFLRALAMPLGYLIFAVPALDIFIDRIHWPFQILTAKASSAMLDLFSVSNFRNAQFVELPNITLEVAEECSGVQYLISIIALSVPLASFLDKWLHRLTLIFLGVIIGICGNWIRVTLIGLWAYSGGKVLHGPMHILQGMFVSVMGFIFLFAAAVFLFRRSAFVHRTHATGEYLLKAHDPKAVNIAWALGLSILVASGIYLRLHDPRPLPLKSSPSEFPSQLGGWRLVDNTSHFSFKGADSETSFKYRNPSGAEVILYIGYYEYQSQGKEFINYEWAELFKRPEAVEIISGDERMTVNKKVLSSKYGASLNMFWFNINGKIVANKYSAKFMTALDGLFTGRTNGAVVIVYSELDNRKDAEKAYIEAADFTGKAIPAVKDYLKVM